MGMREDNYIIGLHAQAGWPAGVRVIVHHLGDRGINVVTSVSAARWAELVTAAVEGELEFFGTLAESVSSEFLSELGHDGPKALRQLFLGLPNL